MTVYTVDFFGTKITTTLTARSSVVEEWIHTTVSDYRRYRDRLIVGLGVQWLAPTFSGEYTPAETLQLCVGRRCLIFQLGHSETVPTLLREFLVHPMNTFVGVWNNKDAAKLLESKHELVVKELFDVRRFVLTRYGESLLQASFEELVSECLGYEGVSLEGTISVSDWDNYRLSDEQIRQACLDAHVSFEIGKRIGAWQFLLPANLQVTITND